MLSNFVHRTKLPASLFVARQIGKLPNVRRAAQPIFCIETISILSISRSVAQL